MPEPRTAPLSLVAALAGAALASVPAAAPAQAQSQSPGKTISQIIVYGDDPCPRSTDDEVFVCARRPAEERYRIPETLRKPGATQERQSWAVRARTLEQAGRTGIGSCSAVGPGGHTGCAAKEINQAFEETGAVETAPE